MKNPFVLLGIACLIIMIFMVGVDVGKHLVLNDAVKAGVAEQIVSTNRQSYIRSSEKTIVWKTNVVNR